MHTSRSLILIIGTLAIVGVAGRMLPHLPNATPLTALALLGSMHLGKKAAFLLPLGVLFATDALLGFYSIEAMVSVYVSFALISLLSIFAQKHRSVIAVGYLILFSATSFFLITNAAVWWFSPWYEKSIAGLLYSYELGLPFFRNMLIGDLAYTFTLMTVFAAVPYLYAHGKRIGARIASHRFI